MMIKVKIQKLEKENKQLVKKQIEFKNDGKKLEETNQKVEKENKWLIKKLTEFKTNQQLSTTCKLEKESEQLLTEFKTDEQLSTAHKLEKESEQLTKKLTEFKTDEQLRTAHRLEKESEHLTKKLTEFKTDEQLSAAHKLEKESEQLTKKLTEFKTVEQLSAAHRLEKESKQLTKKLTEFKTVSTIHKLEKSSKGLSKEIITEVKQLEKFYHLGTGWYGETHVATFNQKNCAIKKLHATLFDQSEPIAKVVAGFKTNCAKCFQLHTCSSNLVMFIDIVEIKRQPVFITELMQMNLFTYIEDMKRKVSLDIQQQLLLCLGMSHGLEALHGNSLIHGNLHDHNVLIRGNQVKISDFYYPLLKIKKDYFHGHFNMNKGLPFVAPEILENLSSPSLNSDIFSLGALVLQVVTGTAPMNREFKKILADVFSDHVLLQLINQCLHKHSQKRPSIAKVCKDIKIAQESAMQKVRLDCL